MALQKQNTKERIALMKEGSAKELVQIEAEYNDKIAKLEEQEKKWKSAQGGKLNSEQKDAIDKGNRSRPKRNSSRRQKFIRQRLSRCRII